MFYLFRLPEGKYLLSHNPGDTHASVHLALESGTKRRYEDAQFYLKFNRIGIGSTLKNQSMKTQHNDRSTVMPVYIICMLFCR